MTYAETLHFLYHSLPVFQHIGGNAYKPGFGNITELEKELGEPHRRFRSVHVAGTNGKGSVSHMTAAVLQAAGYRTGLFTSPHLKDFRERIRVNGIRQQPPQSDRPDPAVVFRNYDRYRIRPLRPEKGRHCGDRSGYGRTARLDERYPPAGQRHHEYQLGSCAIPRRHARKNSR